ncbi:MAG: YbbR-like domain-containing protein [bacterium]|jgi:YbbR domain-containing protein
MDKFLERNIPARLISFALAFFLWLFVVNEQNPEITRSIMVEPELRGLPAGLVLVEDNTAPVLVRFKGRRNDVLGVTEEDLALYVNLAGAVEGDNQQQVRLADVPTGIQVIGIEPSILSIQTERIIQEQIPVWLIKEGVPAWGYTLGEDVLTPTQVMVEGPRSKVEQVARVTVRVPVGGATTDVRAVAPVQVADKQGNPLNDQIKVRPEVVEINIPVSKLPSKQVPVEPQFAGAVAEGYQVDEVKVIPQLINVYGTQDTLDQLEYLETNVLDLSGATDSITQDLRVLLPPGVQSAQEWVRVSVAISAQTEEKTLQVPVQVNNLRAGLEAQVAPDTVSVTVAGPYNLVNSLEVQDIRAFVDVNGFEAGQYRLRVQLALPIDVQQIALEPEEIVLILSPVSED